MTTQEICNAAKENKSCMFYFGENMKQFLAVASNLFGEKRAKKIEYEIRRQQAYHTSGKPLELILHSGYGRFDSWDIFDSIDFYQINLANCTNGWDDALTFDCRRSTKAVIL